MREIKAPPSQYLAIAWKQKRDFLVKNRKSLLKARSIFVVNYYHFASHVSFESKKKKIFRLWIAEWSRVVKIWRKVEKNMRAMKFLASCAQSIYTLSDNIGERGVLSTVHVTNNRNITKFWHCLTLKWLIKFLLIGIFRY